MTTRLSLFGLFLLLCAGCATGPSITRDQIPSDAPAELRAGIDGLYESNPEAVISAMKKLRGMGGQAMPAAPFLATMAGDTRFVRRGMLGTPITIGTYACTTMAQFGEPALLPLIGILRGSTGDRYIRGNVAWGLKGMNAEDTAYRKLRGTEYAELLIAGLRECMGCSDTLLKSNSPQWAAVMGRGGLFTYVEVLGKIGDPKAKENLQKLAESKEFSELERDADRRALAGIQ